LPTVRCRRSGGVFAIRAEQDHPSLPG
jgi:hypothetical protein